MRKPRTNRYLTSGGPKCRICGCSHREPCPAGCGWAPGRGNLCTVCAELVDELGAYIENALHFRPGRLVAEARHLADNTPIPYRVVDDAKKN